MATNEETDLRYLADIFGRRGPDWIVRSIGALPVGPGDSGAQLQPVDDATRTKTVDEIKRWIADLDVVIAKRRGNGLGAESKTFDLVDRQKVLRQTLKLLGAI